MIKYIMIPDAGQMNPSCPVITLHVTKSFKVSITVLLNIEETTL